MSTARLACAAYIRTSTDDQQSPEDSRRWQLDITTRLVAPGEQRSFGQRLAEFDKSHQRVERLQSIG